MQHNRHTAATVDDASKLGLLPVLQTFFPGCINSRKRSKSAKHGVSFQPVEVENFIRGLRRLKFPARRACSAQRQRPSVPPASRRRFPAACGCKERLDCSLSPELMQPETSSSSPSCVTLQKLRHCRSVPSICKDSCSSREPVINQRVVVRGWRAWPAHAV